MHKVCPEGFRVVDALGLFSHIGGSVPVLKGEFNCACFALVLLLCAPSLSSTVVCVDRVKSRNDARCNVFSLQSH